MSLDVYLELPGESDLHMADERIFIRRDGANVEITREEWDELYPGREPVTLVAEMDRNEVFSANITHNLNRMADECGLYEPLWRPDEIGITQAQQLIRPLTKGLARLQSDPERFREFNPENGWGSYELLVEFTENYLSACERWPEAEVRTWR